MRAPRTDARTERQRMTDSTEAPPGAIIPARIGENGEIGLDLPEGWWLMAGEDVGALPYDAWEAASVTYPEAWGSVIGWGSTGRVVVRRRTVQVTVDARPGDRVVVLSPEMYEYIHNDSAPWTEEQSRAVHDAYERAVVAE